MSKPRAKINGCAQGRPSGRRCGRAGTGDGTAAGTGDRTAGTGDGTARTGGLKVAPTVAAELIRIYNILVRILAGLISVLFLFAATAVAQAPVRRKTPAPPSPPPAPASAPAQIPIFRGGVTVVTVPVTVTDEGGDFVTSLNPRDFLLFDNDAEQQINVEPMELPISMVILIGNSARVETLLPEVRKTGILFSSLALGEQGEAAIVTFDHRIEVVQPFTNDADKIEKAFKDLKEGGDQARLNDAIVRALTMLRDRAERRRKVIVVIAEARDSGSESDLGYALREAQIGGISIYAVVLSSTRAQLTRTPPPPAPSPFPPGAKGTYPGIPPTPTAEMQTGGNVNLGAVLAGLVKGVKDLLVKNPLEVYAQGTGAAEIGGFKKQAVEQAVTRIASELHSQYLLTYRPNNLNQPGYHSIRVAVDRPKVKTVTRPGYYLAGVAGGAVPAADDPVKPGDSPKPSKSDR